MYAKSKQPFGLGWASTQKYTFSVLPMNVMGFLNFRTYYSHSRNHLKVLVAILYKVVAPNISYGFSRKPLKNKRVALKNHIFVVYSVKCREKNFISHFVLFLTSSPNLSFSSAAKISSNQTTINIFQRVSSSSNRSSSSHIKSMKFRRNSNAPCIHICS